MPHRERFVTFVGRIAGKCQQNAASETEAGRGSSCSTKQAVGPGLTFDMGGCYATSPMLEKKLEGVGFGAGNKIALNRPETVGKQGGGGRRCRRSLDCSRLLGSKISKVAMPSGDGLETGPALPCLRRWVAAQHLIISCREI